MLNKLSKQQHLLLQELERTKRRLREEIWAREGRAGTSDAARPTNPPDPWESWPHQQSHGSACDNLPNTALNSPSSHRSKKRSSQVTDGGRGLHSSGGGARLKRSRSEAGIGPTDSDVEGVRVERARATKPEESSRPFPSTRIDMLPIMCSTGENARVSEYLSAFIDTAVQHDKYTCHYSSIAFRKLTNGTLPSPPPSPRYKKEHIDSKVLMQL